MDFRMESIAKKQFFIVDFSTFKSRLSAWFPAVSPVNPEIHLFSLTIFAQEALGVTRNLYELTVLSDTHVKLPVSEDPHLRMRCRAWLDRCSADSFLLDWVVLGRQQNHP